jgi:hypothetical protein
MLFMFHVLCSFLLLQVVVMLEVLPLVGQQACVEHINPWCQVCQQWCTIVCCCCDFLQVVVMLEVLPLVGQQACAVAAVPGSLMITRPKLCVKPTANVQQAAGGK